MAELKHPDTLAKAVRDFVAERIIRGELQPGTALSEVPLAKKLEVSRGTMREALRALQDLGLVEIRPHRGAAVAELTIEKAREILSLRARLESWAARLAVERGLVTPQRIVEMENALHDLRVAVDSGDRVGLMEGDMRFHGIVAACSGHDLLLEHLESLRMQTRLVVFYARLYDAVRDSVNDHKPLLDALAGGNPDVAEVAVREHIESSGRRLLAAMERLGTPVPSIDVA